MIHTRTNPEIQTSHLIMNLRSAILIPLIIAGTAATIHAQDVLRAPALLVSAGGTTFQRVWLESSTKSTVRFRDTEVSTATKEARVSQFETIYIYEPSDFAAAVDLFQSRSYAEARNLFVKVKDQYKPLASIENNPSTLAAFYELECLRKIGDLDGLSDALATFDQSALTRESQLRQVEIYQVWEALRAENWQQVESLVNERAKSNLPGDQRAQLSYCHGRALQALDREQEAIAAYHMAMTADAAASEDISRKAALRVITILGSKPEVQRATQVWGTPEENTSSTGYGQLLEASAIAKLFLMSLGGGEPLPPEFRDLPNFRPKDDGTTGIGAAPPPSE
jgi:tetratricopeptide (TPR) repeat protein